MITDVDKTVIINLARQYKAGKVLLFGSSTTSTQEPRDIDLAVEGIPARDFFRFYGDLILGLSKPVDLIDLSGAGQTKFVQLIRREGIPIYG